MKKLFAVLLSIVLVLSMGTTALAATITIDNAVAGETYDIYKMLDFTPVAGSADKGYYTLIAEWEDFFNAAPASNYFDIEVNADGVKIVTMTAEPDADAKAELAKEAVAYAKANDAITATTKTAADAEVIFDGLDTGYYAIDTSLGTTCALVNTDSTFKAVEKNARPDITKEVQEDRDNSWGQVNDAMIGQEVNYRSEITVGAGVTNYVMHDTMDAGLTFIPGSIVVEGADADDYTVTTTCADGCTFEIAFDDDFIAKVGKGNTFVVTYSATLNENAQVEYEDGRGYQGNKNTVYLEYFNETTVKSDEKETVTYTWKLDVFKYTEDGGNEVPLAGAEFQLIDADGNVLKFLPVAGAAVPTYVVSDAENAKDIITTDANGEFVIIGLDEGEYTLHEENAPAGYNRAPDTTIEIGSELVDETYSATYTINNATPDTIKVLNRTGGLFPETGGIGTTIFYVVGALLMLAAVVVLVSKKRMSTFA